MANSFKHGKCNKPSDTVITQELNHGTKLAENSPTATSMSPQKLLTCLILARCSCSRFVLSANYYYSDYYNLFTLPRRNLKWSAQYQKLYRHKTWGFPFAQGWCCEEAEQAAGRSGALVSAATTDPIGCSNKGQTVSTSNTFSPLHWF